MQAVRHKPTALYTEHYLLGQFYINLYAIELPCRMLIDKN
jgi:hypothetical protein